MGQPEEIYEENKENKDNEEEGTLAEEEDEENEESNIEEKENLNLWGEDVVLNTPREGESKNVRTKLQKTS